MKKLNVFHFLIYERLKAAADLYNRIRKKELYALLGYLFHVPKNLRKRIIMDLLDAGIIKDLDRDYFEVNTKVLHHQFNF